MVVCPVAILYCFFMLFLSLLAFLFITVLYNSVDLKKGAIRLERNIIEVSHYTKKYGDFAAVDDISFAVREGTIFAFLGPNGAGKSTTINTLCTILDKTSGDLIINGHDVSRQQDKVRKDIGIVFQETTLDAKLTVEENIRFHCKFYDVPNNEIKERTDFVLGLVDLEEWRKAPVDSLSGGMKRRAEIARGLVHFPKVLFLDEPTAGLDPHTRASVWDYIHKLQQQKNITIFLTTHYMDEAEISDSVAIIDHGKIVAYDSPDRLKAQYATALMKLRTSRQDELQAYLDSSGMAWSLKDDAVCVYTKETAGALELLSRFKNTISDFEVSKGSLNEVFLAVTGREIREQ
jgi:ABC-2 type transport system ATP-binding protein